MRVTIIIVRACRFVCLFAVDGELILVVGHNVFSV